jgi:hypothetical protein
MAMNVLHVSIKRMRGLADAPAPNVGQECREIASGQCRYARRRSILEQLKKSPFAPALHLANLPFDFPFRWARHCFRAWGSDLLGFFDPGFAFSSTPPTGAIDLLRM